MKITRILFSTAIMVALLFSSCQQQKAGQQRSVQSDEPDEFEQKLQNINPGLEDPTIVMAALDMAGAEYIDGLVVPMENVDYYAEDEAQAAQASSTEPPVKRNAPLTVPVSGKRRVVSSPRATTNRNPPRASGWGVKPTRLAA